jgi:hypothetical protein
MPAKKPKNSKEDFSYFMTKLKKGKPISQRFRYLMNFFNPRLTVMQFWVKLDASHMAEKEVPLMTTKFKRVLSNAPVYYQLFASPQDNTLYMKQDDYNLNKKYKIDDVDWGKWQWVGVAAYVKESFQTCVTMLSSAQQGYWFEKETAYDCNPFPAFNSGVLGSFGTWDYNNANSKINASVYGGTIAHEILVNDYYVERNIFLNFLTNHRDKYLEIKNYAREDNKNNGVLVNIGNLKSAKYEDHVTRVFHQGATTSSPYFMIRSKPRNKHNSDYGPLQSSYYVSGYLDMVMNRDYSNLKKDEWEVKVPIYKMIGPKGDVLVDFTHTLNYNKEERFVKKDDYLFNRFRKGKRKLDYVRRVRSKIDTRAKLYHPVTGKDADYINQDKQFESYSINLEDNSKRQTTFMFNVFYRPTNGYYLAKDKKHNFMLTLRHSWGLLQHVPMYFNDQYDSPLVRHLIGTSKEGWTKQYLPVNHIPINFSVTQGPLKEADIKWGERTIKPPKGSTDPEIKLYHINYKSRHLNKYNLMQDMHATFGKQRPYFNDGLGNENWASFFNPGQSFGCDHGFVLMNNGLHTVCSRPPVQGNNYVEQINYDTFETMSKNKPPLSKMPPVIDYFRAGARWQKNNWTPFKHHIWDLNYYGNYYNSYHFYHRHYHRFQDKNCYVNDGKMIRRAEKYNFRYNQKRSKHERSQRECIACRKGYVLATGKAKAAYWATKKYCKRCTVKNCQTCAVKGCKVCKPGFEESLGSCRRCRKKEVYDMWSRRCYKRKKNRYMDIHYNRKDQYIQISDLFSVGKDITAVFDFQIHYKKKKAEPALFKLTVMQGGIESDYYYNFMPRRQKRRFFFRAPSFVGSDLMLKLTIKGQDPKNMKYYKLRNFMYSLQPLVDPLNPRVDTKHDKDSNMPVQIGNASHRKGFSPRKWFDDLITLDIGGSVPEHLAQIKMWNERDEINGNWVQTWFKVGKKPKNQDAMTLISVYGDLANPHKGEFGFQMRLYYSYSQRSLMFRDFVGKLTKVFSYKKYDVEGVWNFVTLMIRKIFVDDEQRFEIHAATSYEHIFKILNNPDDKPGEDDDDRRRLTLTTVLPPITRLKIGRSLDKSDTASKTDKNDTDETKINDDSTTSKEEETKKKKSGERELEVDEKKSKKTEELSDSSEENSIEDSEKTTDDDKKKKEKEESDDRALAGNSDSEGTAVDKDKDETKEEKDSGKESDGSASKKKEKDDDTKDGDRNLIGNSDSEGTAVDKDKDETKEEKDSGKESDGSASKKKEKDDDTKDGDRALAVVDAARDLAKSKKDNHLLFRFPTSFMKMGSSLNIGFGIKNAGDKRSDWSGKLYGSNYYQRLTMPFSTIKLHYVFEKNRRDYSGKMRNWSDPTYDSDGQFVYFEPKSKTYKPWYDETSLKGEKTYIQGKLPKNDDDPTEVNLLLSGLVELSTNGALYRITAEKPSTQTISVFKLMDVDGRDLIHIHHTMFAPKNNRKSRRYTTKSKISVSIAVKNSGKDRYLKKVTKWFKFTSYKDHVFQYNFQFWTTLLPQYFLRKKQPQDMNLHFIDNLGNRIFSKSTTTLWQTTKDRQVLLGQTWEDLDFILKPYSHKWITFSGTMASHNYKLDMVCDAKAKFCNDLQKAPTMCAMKYAMMYNEKEHMGWCAKYKKTYDSCWKDQNGRCVFCRPGFFQKGDKCEKCHESCAMCNEKTCLKCKEGLYWKGGVKCLVCKKG